MRKNVIRLVRVCLVLIGTWPFPFNVSVAETEWKPRLDFLKKQEKYEKRYVANSVAAEHAKTLLAQHGEMALHALLDAKQKNKWSDELVVEVARRLVSDHDIAIEQPDNDGWTVLMQVARNHRDGLLTRLFLELKANVNQVRRSGRTALMEASHAHNSEAITLLCAHSAKLDISDEFGYSPLLAAASTRNTDTHVLNSMNALLSCGANVNYQGGKWGKTALMGAAGERNVPIMKLLLQNGAKDKLTDTSGHTALQYAVRDGFGDEETVEAVEVLLASGADVNQQDDDGVTALMKATEHGYVRIIKLLLEHGAKVDLKNKNGDVAIMYAFGEFDLGKPRKPNREVANLLRSHDPQGYCYYQTHWQVRDAMVVMDQEMTMEESIPDEDWRNDQKVRNMTDLYNFMGTFDVQECSTQYQFVFRRLKGNMGTFIQMYQEWKKGPVFSKYRAADMNAQRRAHGNALSTFIDTRSPY